MALMLSSTGARLQRPILLPILATCTLASISSDSPSRYLSPAARNKSARSVAARTAWPDSLSKSAETMADRAAACPGRLSRARYRFRASVAALTASAVWSVEMQTSATIKCAPASPLESCDARYMATASLATPRASDFFRSPRYTLTFARKAASCATRSPSSLKMLKASLTAVNASSNRCSPARAADNANKAAPSPAERAPRPRKRLRAASAASAASAGFQADDK
mmetsp:Transcript_127960/g.368672  ORF Transcript_127960/g.368672 Transcript_127960/m.368672 type:complete len:225 (+) Transcript_127960:1090-1764(+)